MSEARSVACGLDLLLSEIDDRYASDARGRLISARFDGILPRFVLGRAAEGCIWRFRADLERGTVVAIARLAGREPGIPIAGKIPGDTPERLVMIERLLARSSGEGVAGHEVLTRDGVGVAELWTID